MGRRYDRRADAVERHDLDLLGPGQALRVDELAALAQFVVQAR